jgi:hypothetical protein
MAALRLAKTAEMVRSWAATMAEPRFASRERRWRNPNRGIEAQSGGETLEMSEYEEEEEDEDEEDEDCAAMEIKGN